MVTNNTLQTIKRVLVFPFYLLLSIAALGYLALQLVWWFAEDGETEREIERCRDLKEIDEYEG